MPTPRPVRVALVNDYELVIAGLAAVLAPYGDRVRVVETVSRLPVLAEVDVVLYDSFGQRQGAGLDLQDLVRESEAKVVVFSWNVQTELVQQSLAQGARGYLSKQMSSAAIVAAIEHIHAGGTVSPAGEPTPDEAQGRWPGLAHGLTAREAEVVALITQGLTNQEVAARTFLSINSVKTYIRLAYRKMGVTSRSQAVVWAIRHGFEPDQHRSAEAPGA